MHNANFLGEEKISSLLIKFSVPAITGMMVGALYNVVDSIFVGRGVGTYALTAVTIAFPIMIMLLAVGLLVGVGASNMVSISLGRKDKDSAEIFLGNALTLSIAFMLLTVVGAFYFLDELLINVLGATPDVFPYARDFISIILMGSVFMHVGFGLNNIIRSQGDPKTALMTQVISFILNAVLNYIFIFKLGLGVKGSALATVISQASAAFWVIFYFSYGRGVLRLRWKNLIPHKAYVIDILKIGCAPFLMQVGASAVTIVLNLRIMVYGGEIGVAAFGIIGRIFMLIMMPIIGICQGAQPIIGYNYGAKHFDRVLSTLNKSMMAATVLCVFSFVGIELFAERIVNLFNDSQQLELIGARGMRIYLALIPVFGFPVVGAHYFQAIGKAQYAVAFNLLRQVVVFIPAVFLLSEWFGLAGIWASGAVSDFAAALFMGACLYIDVGKYKKIASMETVPEAIAQ